MNLRIIWDKTQQISGQTDEYSPTKKIKQFHTQTNLPFIANLVARLWHVVKIPIIHYDFLQQISIDGCELNIQKMDVYTKTCEVQML